MVDKVFDQEKTIIFFIEDLTYIICTSFELGLELSEEKILSFTKQKFPCPPCFLHHKTKWGIFVEDQILY